MDTAQIIQAVSTVGFPIVLCIYLISKFDQRIEDLKGVVNQLGEATRELTKSVDEMRKERIARG